MHVSHQMSCAHFTSPLLVTKIKNSVTKLVKVLFSVFLGFEKKVKIILDSIIVLCNFGISWELIYLFCELC